MMRSDVPEIHDSQDVLSSAVYNDPGYFVRASNHLTNVSQVPRSMARSQSMPSRSWGYDSTYVDEDEMEDVEHENDETNPSISLRFRNVVTPCVQVRTPNVAPPSRDLRTLTRRTSEEFGTLPTRRRMMSLPFAPPFLHLR